MPARRTDLVVLVAVALSMGCSYVVGEDDCEDEYGEYIYKEGGCHWDLFNDLRMNDSVVQECCGSNMYLHAQKCEKNGTVEHEPFVCVDSEDHAHHMTPPEPPLHVQNCTEPCKLQLFINFTTSTNGFNTEEEAYTKDQIKDHCQTHMCDVTKEKWMVRKHS